MKEISKNSFYYLLYYYLMSIGISEMQIQGVVVYGLGLGLTQDIS